MRREARGARRELGLGRLDWLVQGRGTVVGSGGTWM